MSKRIEFSKVDLLKSVSKKRYLLGVLLGLSFSFIFYAFLFTLRETLRVLFSVIVDSNFLLILVDREVSFYNMIFAIFSSILGLSLTLKIIFEKPKQFKSNNRYYYRKSMIFVDTNLLHFSFLSVSLRILFIPIAIFGSVFPYYLSYYDNYKFLIYIALIALFLEQWKTIRLIFKNKALKWMLISIVSILAYSFVISKINIIDYQKINNQVLKGQPLYGYELNLPQFKNYKKIESRYLAPQFYVTYKKGKINHANSPVIIYNNEEFTLDNVSEIIEIIKERYHEHDLPWVTFKLNIDKNVKMKHVSQLKLKLAENDFLKIAYGIVKEGSGLPKELTLNLGVFEKLKQVVNTKYPPPPQPIFDKDHTYTIVLGEQTKKINHIEIENFIRKSPLKNYIQIKPTDFTTINDYLEVKDELLSVYLKLRNEYSIKTYGKLFRKLNYEQIKDIKINIYPIIIWLDD